MKKLFTLAVVALLIAGCKTTKVYIGESAKLNLDVGITLHDKFVEVRNLSDTKYEISVTGIKPYLSLRPSENLFACDTIWVSISTFETIIRSIDPAGNISKATLLTTGK